MRPIVWVSEPLVRPLSALLPADVTVVTSPEGFLAVERETRTPSFFDRVAIDALERFATDLGGRSDERSALQLRKLISVVSSGPIIGICEPPLAAALSLLPSHPWLSNLVSLSIFEETYAKDHVANIISFSASRDPRLLDWLQPTDAGRRVRLTHANRCAERVERMRQFFDSQGLAPDHVERLRAAAQELLVNAFYDAPVAAGASGSSFIDRSSNVALPEELPCDFAYGCREGVSMIRVRDPFGALSRERVVRAFSGPAKGLAKVFASSSIFAISTIRNQMTEVLVGISSAHAASPMAFHFFNREGSNPGKWKLTDDDTGSPALHKSVTVTFVG